MPTFLTSEMKRKLYHHLSLGYLLFYIVFSRAAALWVLGLLLLALSAVEWIRLRRPEVNDRFLRAFGGLHREEEIMRPSGIFWTLLGTWTTLLVFTNQRVVLPALGFLVFGDTVAALAGRRWARHPWPRNPLKSYEGSAGFVLASTVWAITVMGWPAALLSSLAAAWFESRSYRWNDNFWVPLLGGVAASCFNIALGRRGGGLHIASKGLLAAYAVALALIVYAIFTALSKKQDAS
jgi:dolichol kinase